jgi:arylamine N-acetyltransferase
MVDAATRDRLLARVGLALQQLGESEPPDPGQLVERVLHRGRGGDCFEANTVLRTLLEALGFTV